MWKNRNLRSLISSPRRRDTSRGARRVVVYVFSFFSFFFTSPNYFTLSLSLSLSFDFLKHRAVHLHRSSHLIFVNFCHEMIGRTKNHCLSLPPSLSLSLSPIRLAHHLFTPPCCVSICLSVCLSVCLWAERTPCVLLFLHPPTHSSHMSHTPFSPYLRILLQINLDVARTFPGHQIFGSEPGHSRLRELLSAYATHSPHVGYVQGMGYPLPHPTTAYHTLPHPTTPYHTLPPPTP